MHEPLIRDKLQGLVISGALATDGLDAADVEIDLGFASATTF